MPDTDKCTEITPFCPISATTYGYYPNLGANVFLVIIFATCAIVQIALGIKYRVRFYTTMVFLGCAGEAIGYIGRIMMHSNPWSHNGFIIQILLLIVSPSFLAAGLYLTLKHLVLHYGPQYSRLQPKFYTWLFITCDTIGFLMQVVGGGIEASADGKSSSSKSLSDTGNVIMIAGISFQAVTMGICGLLAFDFAHRLYKHRAQREDSSRTVSPKGPKAFAFYMGCTIAAFVAVLVRCIYRYATLWSNQSALLILTHNSIPEMAAGWGNSLMRNETEFMIFDGG